MPRARNRVGTLTRRGRRRCETMVRSSRITFSSAAAIAMAGAGGSSSSDDDEAGEEIESAPPLRVGEERAIGPWGIRKRLLRDGQGWATPVPPDEVSGSQVPPSSLHTRRRIDLLTALSHPVCLDFWFRSALRWDAPRWHAVCVDEGRRRGGAPHDQSRQW